MLWLLPGRRVTARADRVGIRRAWFGRASRGCSRRRLDGAAARHAHGSPSLRAPAAGRGAALARRRPLGALTCSRSGWARCRPSRASAWRAGCSARACGLARPRRRPVRSCVLGAVTLGAGARARDCAIGSAVTAAESTSCDLCGLPVIGRPVRSRADSAARAARRVWVGCEDCGLVWGLSRSECAHGVLVAAGATARSARRPPPARAPGGRPCGWTACGARRARWCSRRRCWGCRAWSTQRSATRRRLRGSPWTRRSTSLDHLLERVSSWATAPRPRAGGADSRRHPGPLPTLLRLRGRGHVGDVADALPALARVRAGRRTRACGRTSCSPAALSLVVLLYGGGRSWRARGGRRGSAE